MLCKVVHEALAVEQSLPSPADVAAAAAKKRWGEAGAHGADKVRIACYMYSRNQVVNDN